MKKLICCDYFAVSSNFCLELLSELRYKTKIFHQKTKLLCQQVLIDYVYSIACSIGRTRVGLTPV